MAHLGSGPSGFLLSDCGGKHDGSVMLSALLGRAVD